LTFHDGQERETFIVKTTSTPQLTDLMSVVEVAIGSCHQQRPVLAICLGLLELKHITRQGQNRPAQTHQQKQPFHDDCQRGYDT